jgi:hypothetical protein
MDPGVAGEVPIVAQVEQSHIAMSRTFRRMRLRPIVQPGIQAHKGSKLFEAISAFLRGAADVEIRVHIGFIVAASSLVSATYGAGKDASYYCVVEAAGGLSYNPTIKKWSGTSFRPEGKFILKMKFIKTGPSPFPWSLGKTADQYAVTITPSGQDYGMPCVNNSLQDPNIIAVEDVSAFKCEAFDS